jgi:hypothetical protein
MLAPLFALFGSVSADGFFNGPVDFLGSVTLLRFQQGAAFVDTVQRCLQLPFMLLRQSDNRLFRREFLDCEQLFYLFHTRYLIGLIRTRTGGLTAMAAKPAIACFGFFSK